MSIRDDHETCMVCEKLRPCEQHHLIPQRVGGPATPTAPLCRSCHDAVDRMRLRDWDPAEAMAGMLAIWDRLDVPGRLLFLKLFGVTCEIHAARPMAARAAAS